jgi:hypothetical protein
MTAVTRIQTLLAGEALMMKISLRVASNDAVVQAAEGFQAQVAA